MWDDKLKMYDNTDCFASTADNDSGDSLDFEAAKAAIGDGRPVIWHVAVGNEAVAGGTSIQPVLCDSPDGTTWTKRMFGPVVAVASAVVGALLFEGPLPSGLARHVKTVFANVGANTTGHAISRLM